MILKFTPKLICEILFIIIFLCYFTILSAAPKAPAGLVATAVSNNCVILSWDAPSDEEGITEYYVYRNGSGQRTYNKRTYYIADGLTALQQYNFYVVAYNSQAAEGDRYSQPSETVSAVTLSSSHVPTTYYVDNTLVSDITDGSYSVSKRSGEGSDGNAYKKIQTALNIALAGDNIYMREGEYTEEMKIPNFPSQRKSGTSDNYITLSSYPGEWAKINGWIKYESGDQRLRFWRFQKFEINKGFISIYGADNLDFRYLYIHDNPYGRIPGDEYYAGAVTFPNQVSPAMNVSIKYCWFPRNTSGIKFFSDYRENPEVVKINEALSMNELAYNLIEDDYSHSLHYKNNQALSLDNSGTHTTYNYMGDKIHHNIIRNSSGNTINSQDFMQIYKNVFDNTKIDIGSNYSSDREPFYVCVYNNLFRNTTVEIAHGNEWGDGVYDNYALSESSPAHPYYYHYNNIHEELSSRLNIIMRSGDWPETYTDMNTIDINKNLFYKVKEDDQVIHVGTSFYSTKGYYEKYGKETYASDSPGLYIEDSYVSQGSFAINGTYTISNAGKGGTHPYLQGINIPSYLGHSKPDDNAWIAGIESLSEMNSNGIPINLRDAQNDPDWIEGGVISGNNVPVINPIPKIECSEGETVSFEIKVDDFDPEDNINLSCNGMPDGASFVQTASRSWQFEWKTGSNSGGTYSLIFQANDGKIYSNAEKVDILINEVYAVPNAPAGLVATAVSNNCVILSWDAPSDEEGITEYYVYRNGSGQRTYDKKAYFIFEGLTSLTEYEFYVVAYNGNAAEGNKYSQPSETVSAVTLSSSHVPTTYYVDNTLVSDITDGSYSVSKRSGGGSDGNAYKKIQTALNTVLAGDNIYMREGEYTEKLKIPNFSSQRKSGTSDNLITLSSYPGEWAKINGWIKYESGNQRLRFWRFQKFEINQGFISIYGADNLDFRYLYIHDNPYGRYAGEEYNAGAITFPNQVSPAMNVSIKYCWFPRNTTGIKFFSDYRENPELVKINEALSMNELAYNLIEDDFSHSLHYKNNQVLSLDNSGTHTTYNYMGDKIHHNIIRNSLGNTIDSQDFMQIYKNVFDNTKIGIGSNSSSDREPFYVCVYNNLFRNTSIELAHGTDWGDGVYDNYALSESSPAHPYYYHYNNIHEELSSRLNIIMRSGVWPETYTDMNTIDINKNLFYKVKEDDQVIHVGTSFYSTKGYYKKYGKETYASDSPGLYIEDSYVSQGSFAINGTYTISNAGTGGDHPYLQGIKIPSYIGPTNPDDNAWFSGIESLTKMDNNGIPVNLRDASDDPEWIEGGNGTTGLQNESENRLETYFLSQNYPNPFNPSTTIKFNIPNNSVETQHAASVQLKIFDILGREVATLVNEHKPAGNYTVEWNGTNSAGQLVGSGIYFYQLKTSNGFMETKKMLLIK